MGAKKINKQTFLKNHPNCCFCGGATTATTQDHIPARSLFLGRWWPEGYVFPSCEECNKASREDEQMMAAIVRLGPNNQRSEKEHVELMKAMNGFRNNQPEIFKKLEILSRIETRQRLRALGQRGTALVTGEEAYLVRIPEEFFESAERYAVKLGKALHYFHTGKIVSHTGKVTAKCFLQLELLDQVWHDNLLGLLGGKPKLVRAAKLLGQQFDYRYARTEDGEGAAYLVEFGKGVVNFTIAIFLNEENFQTRRAQLLKESGEVV